MNYKLRETLLGSGILVAGITALMLGIGIWHRLWDTGHYVLASAYVAQCVGAVVLFMQSGQERDRLTRIVERAERETGREFRY